MDSLFGLPTDRLAYGAAAALLAVLLGLALLAWRRPVLVRIGLRSAPRRPLRALLIVAGLTTSTAVIATAIGTGETMAGTIRGVVAGGVGPVDEIIVSPGSAPRTPGLTDPKAVLAGGDLAAGAFFPESQAQALRTAAGESVIAALTPAAQTKATAVSAASGRARTGVDLFGLGGTEAAFTSFSSSDGAVSIADLEPGEVLVNQQAATLLEVKAGDDLLLHLAAEREAGVRVRAVVADGGIAGVQPALIAPLGAVQFLLNKPGQINQILVSNRGKSGSASVSKAVTGQLRLSLADADTARQLARSMATEAGQSQLQALAGRVRPDARAQILRLHTVAKSGQATPELAYFLGDPALTTQYRWVLNAVATDPSLRGNGDLVQKVAPLTVLEVKQRALNAANEYGSAVTTVFLILGLFSIAASLLLVFLIFVMLAAERRTEMGLMRAVGVQRYHLVAAFAVEGLAYDLAASLIGLGLGLGIGALVLRLIGGVLSRYDVGVHGQMSGGSIVLSFCLGALVTFLTVLAAAWRVSRVNIIAAIHGFAEPEETRRRRAGLRRLLAPLRYFPTVLLALSGALLLRQAGGPGPLLAAGGSLLVLAAALALRSVLVGLGAARSIVDRLIASTAGPAIALFFALSPSTPRAVRSDAVVRSGTAGFVLAGVVMALALVWAAGRNLDVILWPLRVVARPFGRVAPAVRMAVAYPLTHPFRTSLTAAMFALVFLTMVSATALLRSTEEAYVRRDGGAGFDIRASFTTPPTDFSAGLAASTSVRPEDFTAIGAQSMSAVEALWPAEARALWRPLDLRVANADLLGGSSGELIARASGLNSDEAVWRRLRDQPGTVIVAKSELSTLPAIEAAVQSTRRSGVVSFTPSDVWVRDPRGGIAKKLTVIGVTADGSILPSGLLTSAASLTGSPAADQPPAEYYLRAREDVSFRSAATGVALTFPENGVKTRVLGDEARTGHAVRGMLDTLIRGFLGMGLASGIAALGVIGMRSVAERRQQIGMMRAIGFSRRTVQATFLLEGSVVAILGITVGGVVGLVLARNVVAFLARDFTQLRLSIPWLEIAAIGGAAYGAALLSALLVAWQAGRVSPAEALRYE